MSKPSDYDGRGLTEVDDRGADFSPCRQYRYALWRHWDWQGHANCVMFIGLNPSTADETDNDTTISKCIGFAKKWGYGGIYMLNLFAFKATHPSEMFRAAYPIGPGNDEALAYHRTRCGLIVAAWGAGPSKSEHGWKWLHRVEDVKRVISKPLWCLGTTKDGSPRHPSRIGYATERELFWGPQT